MSVAPVSLATSLIVARDTGATLIDNAAYIDALGGETKEKLFFDSLHMYCEGYSLLAENILREFQNQKLVPVQ